MNTNFKFNIGDTMYYPNLSTHSGVFEIVAGVVTQLNAKQSKNGEPVFTYFTQNYTSVNDSVAFTSEQECREAMMKLVSTAPVRIPHAKDIIFSEELENYGS
jgi:hypothetical protein